MWILELQVEMVIVPNFWHRQMHHYQPLFVGRLVGFGRSAVQYVLVVKAESFVAPQ